MEQDALVVTAADEAFAGLLEGLLASLRRHGWPLARVAVLDCGLDPASRVRLARRGVVLADPGFRLPDLPPGEPAYRALAARPHLPGLLPGPRTYLWIDADAWVQDGAALALILGEARRRGLAVAAEDDPAYGPMVGPDPDRPTSRLEDWTAWVFADALGPEAALAQAGLPLLNCGVWAAEAASPLWGLWAEALQGAWASARHYRFFADQAAFNRVVHGSLPGFARLPAWCNWLCHRAWPLAGPGGDLLLPRPPHRRLGIVHRAGDTKTGLAPLPTPEGDRTMRSLACPWAPEEPG